jgi:hypothetical protein
MGEAVKFERKPFTELKVKARWREIIIEHEGHELRLRIVPCIKPGGKIDVTLQVECSEEDRNYFMGKFQAGWILMDREFRFGRDDEGLIVKCDLMPVAIETFSTEHGNVFTIAYKPIVEVYLKCKVEGGLDIYA